jgi:hypothetical protein
LVCGVDDAPLDELDSLLSIPSDDDDECFSLTSSDSEATDTDLEHALLTEVQSGDCEVCLSCLPHPICPPNRSISVAPSLAWGATTSAEAAGAAATAVLLGRAIAVYVGPPVAVPATSAS